MSKSTFVAGLLLVCVSVIGCATSEQFVPFPEQSVKLEDPGRCRIYVIRDAGVKGAVCRVLIKDSERDIGITGPKSYLCWERQARPGKTRISSKNLTPTCGVADNEIIIDLVTGHVHYVRLVSGPAIFEGKATNVKFELVDPAKGKRLLSKCKPPGKPK